MLRAFRKYGGRGRRVTSIIGTLLEVLIIGGLLYAGLFVKAEVDIPQIPQPAIEKRDAFYGVAVPAPKIIWAVGTGGKIVRSDDDGQSWSVQSAQRTAHLQSIATWDKDRAVVVGNNGAVLTTRDGGRSWAPSQAPLSKVANKLLKVKALDAGKAWAVGEMGALLFSEDFGATWTRRAEEKDVAWNDIFFVGDNGWLVGEFGQMMMTTDGGASWKAVAAPVKSSLMGVAFRDKLNGVAVGVAGTILSTRDGGKSWSTADSGTREHLLNVIWDGNSWIAVGDKGVLVTGGLDGAVSRVTRVAESHLGWSTQIIRDGEGYVLAGAVLARMGNGGLRMLGRKV
ncbi:MAG: glycosyl hydrolase [Betaproteobacteria bacterium]|nr:glycosyl hydrolase [Betaproteobacteria bacterium]